MSADELKDSIDELGIAVDMLTEKVNSLEEQIEYTEEVCSAETDSRCSDLDLAIRKIQSQIEEMQKALSLAHSPLQEDLDQSSTLRNAYKEYEFVKRLVIGND